MIPRRLSGSAGATNAEDSHDWAGLQYRHEIPSESCWDLGAVYGSDHEFERAFVRVEQLLARFERHRERLCDSAAALLEALTERDALFTLISELATFARLRRDEDTEDDAGQELDDRAAGLATRVSAATAFVEPELAALSEARFAALADEEPRLRLYEHHVRDLQRQRAHIRSAEVESVLAQAGELGRAPFTTFTMLTDADFVFPAVEDEDGTRVKLSHARYGRLLERPDRDVRRRAFETFNGVYAAFKNTLGATLAGSIRRDIFYARARGYASTLDAALTPDNVAPEIFHGLTAVVQEGVGHLHRYLRLRRAMLAVDELRMWDLNVPLVRPRSRAIPYGEAQRMVTDALKPLGSEYGEVLERAFGERWIDVYESRGKRSGAYSSGSYTTAPYILLNYQGDIDSVFTLIHELGHSVHSFLSHASQPFVYAYTTILAAEVASTLNEVLLLRHLLDDAANGDERAIVLDRYLDRIVSTVYRQTLFSEFELAMHQRAEAGGSVTPRWLSEAYRARLCRYYGPEVTIDGLAELEWCRIPHFYTPFYVYKYVTGLSAAIALAEQITGERDAAVARYLAFLRAGSSDHTLDLLRRAGVDMSGLEPVRVALKVFDRLVSEMETAAI